MSVTISSQKDHDRKVSALKRARAIWAKTADTSREAAHATKVLDHILSRVSNVPDSGAAGTTTTTTSGGRRLAAASVSSDRSPGSTSSPSDLLQCRTPPIPLGWSAVNYSVPLRSGRGQSMNWDFGLDSLDRHPGAGRSGGRLDGFIGGDVDWVRISVICLTLFFSPSSFSDCGITFLSLAPFSSSFVP